MSDRSGSLQEVLVAAFQNQANQINTAIPCIVVAIRDSLNGAMVDIQPTVNQRFKDGEVKERPVVLGVPVAFPVSSTAGLTFPIKVGSTGIAVFSMRNLDAWKNSSGRPTTPLNYAKFDKGDAMFIPGIQPPGESVNNPSKRTWPHSTEDVARLGVTDTEFTTICSLLLFFRQTEFAVTVAIVLVPVVEEILNE